MSNTRFGIFFFTLSAVILLLINFSLMQPATAAETVNSRDWIAITARIQDGGEALYVVDNRTGMMAVFSFDAGRRAIVPRDVRPVQAAFPR